MFKSNTVFVVGAGASAEVGLPVGSELLDTIYQSLNYDIDYGRLQNHDSVLFGAWQNYSKNDNTILNEHLKAARRIQDGIAMVRSIDNLLHIHDGDERIKFCGKTAIVRAILEAEKSSKLMPDEPAVNSQIVMSRLTDTWYVEFARLLMEGRQVSDIENMFQGISIICFNYDRCIPHFLRYALQALYQIPIEDAERIVGNLEIYHPYGTVGKLKTKDNPSGVAFGASVPSNGLVELSNGIKTFTEQIDDATTLNQIESKITDAEHLIFLGFGFHKQNMEILTPNKKGPIKRVFATAYEISESNCSEVEHSIRPLGKNALHEPNLNIKNDLTCVELFRHFQMSL